MLSILHVDPERRWGGGQVHLLELCRQIRKLGLAQNIACHPEGPLHHALEREGFATFPVPIRNAVDLRGVLGLRRILKALPFNVVHLHTAHAHAMSPWLPRDGRSLVVTRHMDYAPSSPWLFNNAVDGAIAICEAVRRSMLSAGVIGDRVRVIYLGIDLTPWGPSPGDRTAQRREWGIGEHEIVVLTAAVLEERKGHRHLIEAIARLRGEGAPAARFVLCGTGSQERRLRAQVQAAGLQDVVRLTGFCHNVPRALAAADLFVLPSLAEGLPVSIMEAMATHLPVIATKVSGSPEIVAHDRTGLLVPPAAPEAMARAIGELLRDAERRRQMGVAGRARVAEQFNSERMAREFVAFYEHLRYDPPTNRRPRSRRRRRRRS